VANNARFLILEPGRWPNLASRALALCTARLAQDWQALYGHTILVVESFVDSQLFRATAYKANGWEGLGKTAGFTRVAQDFYVAQERPKQLWVKALEAQARGGRPRARRSSAWSKIEPHHAPMAAEMHARRTCAERSSRAFGLHAKPAAAR
jgi:hypothetical protein